MANHTQQTNELRFRGQVVKIHLGEVARIVVQLGDKRIESTITLESAEQLQFKPGDEVTVVIGVAGVRLTKAGAGV